MAMEAHYRHLDLSLSDVASMTDRPLRGFALTYTLIGGGVLTILAGMSVMELINLSHHSDLISIHPATGMTHLKSLSRTLSTEWSKFSSI